MLKIALNKAILAQMPDEIRVVATEWKKKYRKRYAWVGTAESFYPAEDVTVRLFNLLSGATGKARVAGEFAGLAPLSPTGKIPLPHGTVAVVTYFFCGVPQLDIYQSAANAPITSGFNALSWPKEQEVVCPEK